MGQSLGGQSLHGEHRSFVSCRWLGWVFRSGVCRRCLQESCRLLKMLLLPQCSVSCPQVAQVSMLSATWVQSWAWAPLITIPQSSCSVTVMPPPQGHGLVVASTMAPHQQFAWVVWLVSGGLVVMSYGALWNWIAIRPGFLGLTLPAWLPLQFTFGPVRWQRPSDARSSRVGRAVLQRRLCRHGLSG